MIILTRCQIFHLKCTKFNFGELAALPRHSSWIWEKGKRERRGRKEDGRGKGEGGKK